MRFTSCLAALAGLALAGSAVAQIEPAGPCPGGANMELTALTLPRAPASVPRAPKLEPAPPPPPRPPRTPKRRPSVPQTGAVPRPEPEPGPAFVPRRGNADAALDDMIGSFGSRPASRPVIDESQPFPREGGIGAQMRDSAEFLAPRERLRDRPRSRPQAPPARSAPQSNRKPEPESLVPHRRLSPRQAHPASSDDNILQR